MGEIVIPKGSGFSCARCGEPLPDAADRAVEEILAESDEKLWAGLEARVDARIREHDRRLAARLREAAGEVREHVPVPQWAATKTAHLLADILEADDG